MPKENLKPDGQKGEVVVGDQSSGGGGAWKLSCPTVLKVADVGYKVTVTSFAVSMVITPLNMLITNLQMARKPSGFEFIKSLAKAYPPYVLSGQQRGAISVTSKTIGSKKAMEMEDALAGQKGDADVKDVEGMNFGKPMETETVEPEGAPLRSVGLTRFYHHSSFQALTFSQLDAIFPAYYSNRGKLVGAGKTVVPFSLSSYLKYSSMGYAFRSLSCGVSFGLLLIGSDKVSAKIPLKDKTSAGFVGGAFTGALSAMLTHPINEAHDRLVLKSTVDAAGKVSSVSSFSFFKTNVLQPIRLNGFWSAAMSFWLSSARTLPPRVLSSMCIFGIIQGLNAYLSPTAISDRFSPS